MGGAVLPASMLTAIRFAGGFWDCAFGVSIAATPSSNTIDRLCGIASSPTPLTETAEVQNRPANFARPSNHARPESS
jgi:hypothetical protein